jgi:hypothetical protein
MVERPDSRRNVVSNGGEVLFKMTCCPETKNVSAEVYVAAPICREPVAV